MRCFRAAGYVVINYYEMHQRWTSVIGCSRVHHTTN